MSTSAQEIPSIVTAIERRFYPRIVPQAPIFVALSECGDSLLLNLSENGLLLSTPAELTCNFVTRLSLSLHGLPKPVEVTVHVVWASEARNLAGVQLLDLSEYDREQIRKWGARESTQSSQQEPEHTLLVVSPSERYFETADVAPTTPAPISGASFNASGGLVSRLPHPTTLPSSTLISAGRVTRNVVVATLCLACAVLLIKAAPSNPFKRSLENSVESSARWSLAPSLPSGADNPALPEARIASTAAPPPNRISVKSNGAVASGPGLENSPQTTVAVSNLRPIDRAIDRSHGRPDDSETNAIPLAPPKSETNPKAPFPSPIPQNHDLSRGVLMPAAPELTASPSPPVTLNIPLLTPTRPNNNSSVISSTIPSNPIIAPRVPASSRNSGAPIIQMDAPRKQTFEVRLPPASQDSFLNLPGERVLETPAVTMHIRRSVLMPATHTGWPFNKNKTVVVGELISRQDPQAAQLSPGSGGAVRVRATVAKDGRIQNVRLILGPANLLPAVADALHEWRYQPTLVDNKPVETQCYVVFEFHAQSYRAARR